MNQNSKSPEILEVMDGISDKLFGRKRSDCVELHICVSCGEDASVFNTDLSAREFEISGLCQNCQDKVFGPDDL